MARPPFIGMRSSARHLSRWPRGIARRRVATVSAALLLGASAALLGAGGAGAAVGCGPSGALAGIVDVESHLGYQNAATLGTGIVIDGSGKVLTNNHVVRGATAIKISDVCSGKTYSATVVGYDPAVDVALLQLAKASGLPAVALGNSATVKIGDAVTAIGNAGGAGGTPSQAGGKVIGLNRSITATDESGNPEPLSGLIRVSASLRPGDSGGPLVDAAGKVIGIDTAGSNHFSFQQGDDGDGYAIPIKRALAIASRIEQGRASTTTHIGPTAFLGVHIEPPSRYSGSARAGALVTAILPGAPAARAGILPGDVIFAVGGRKIASPGELTNSFLRMSPGTTVGLGWIDQTGKTRRASVTLVAGPPQ